MEKAIVLLQAAQAASPALRVKLIREALALIKAILLAAKEEKAAAKDGKKSKKGKKAKKAKKASKESSSGSDSSDAEEAEEKEEESEKE